MNNVFEKFKLNRDIRLRCNYRQNLRYNIGYFHPSCSFTKPIKDGKLTNYAKVLVSAYINDQPIYSRNAIKLISSTNWQTIRYSGLVYENTRGEYELTVEGKEYCELICKELVKANL